MLLQIHSVKPQAGGQWRVILTVNGGAHPTEYWDVEAQQMAEGTIDLGPNGETYQVHVWDADSGDPGAGVVVFKDRRPQWVRTPDGPAYLDRGRYPVAVEAAAILAVRQQLVK
jgi:hypothetical protein